MSFIQLHSIVENRPFYLNMNKIETMEWIPRTQTEQSAYTAIETSYGCTAIKMMNEVVYYCKETTVEILQKITEAEQRHERSFMDEWKREVDDQLSKLTVRKDGATDATDRW